MPTLNAQQVADRWSAGMKAAVTKIKEGVMATTTNPMLEAIKSKDKYINNVLQSAQDGTWEEGLRSASFDDWKTKTGVVGSGRISAGVEAAKPKMLNFLTQFLPAAEAAKQMAKGMPNATLEDRIARSAAVQRQLANFKLRRSR